MNDASGAPPRTTWGNGADAVRTGAHLRHVALYDCSACHLKPADALAPGHLDGPTATVTFLGLSTQGTSPSWNRSSATCAATYCHGGTLAGGTHRTPVWTVLDGTQRTCDSCHGAPPANAYHTRTDRECSVCHGAGYSAAQATVGTKHVDGIIDFTVSCTSCHGDAARPGAIAAAPPAATHGETATSARAVGAHQRHLLGGTMTNPIACGECHVVPTSTLHASGAVALTFGPLAKAGGSAPAWNRTANTCSATWCHGGKLSGGSRTTPVWTTVNGTQATCGTCHGIAPDSGRHGEWGHQRASCRECHGGTYSESSVDKALHVNGLLDVKGSRIRSWDPASKRCSPTCHGSESWDSSGGGWR
ncbi:MAG: CxxxxCH/CxxCH domain c-type cytochrome [Myxococcales bacterium]